MSESLVLDSLEIRNFRAFRHLRIERLGRVNLIAGKNNVGKTCLLEALWLYARRGNPQLIGPLLKTRDELDVLSDGIENSKEFAASLKHLFCGRKDIREYPASIQLGPIDSENDNVVVTVVWYAEQTGEQQRVLRLIEPEEYRLVEAQVPGLVIQRGKWKFSYPLDRSWSSISYARLPPEFKEVPCFFVPAGGLAREQIGQWWDDIALTDSESDVLDSLRLIAPKVERVSVTIGQERAIGRIPIVRLKNSNDPIPLRSLGEGMNRLFGLALALVNAKDGLLLVDEIDSGLHYSVQPDLWRLVFQVAQRLNVQVFATTHSWDCVRGFQQAAQEDAEAYGMYIRLEERNGEIVAILFDEDRLGIATREEIEIR
jgi:predicted ATPase